MAAAAVLANQGAAGVDHQSCDQFATHLGDELDRLGQVMREHRYQPLPVRRVWIPKPGVSRCNSCSSATAEIHTGSKKWLALITTDTTLSADEVIRLYGKRWDIGVSS